jgi:hypothetical protein
MERITERHPVPGPVVYGYLRVPASHNKRRQALSRALAVYCEEHELLLSGVFTDRGEPAVMSPAFAGLLGVLALDGSYGVVTPARSHLGVRGIGVQRADLIAQTSRRLMVLRGRDTTAVAQ